MPMRYQSREARSEKKIDYTREARSEMRSDMIDTDEIPISIAM